MLKTSLKLYGRSSIISSNCNLSFFTRNQSCVLQIIIVAICEYDGALINKNGIDLIFDSAGIRHYFETPREGTVKYLNSKGISVDGFVAKDLTEELINKQDLILGFEARYHTRKVKRKFKHIKNLDKKVHLLREFAGEESNLEIEDPIHLPYEEYVKILQVIEAGVIKSIEKIIEINRTED